MNNEGPFDFINTVSNKDFAKKFENMTKVDALILAMKLKGDMLEKVAVLDKIYSDAVSSIKRLEKGAQNPKKRSRDESPSFSYDSAHTPDSAQPHKKIKNPKMTKEEALTYRDNHDKADKADSRELLKVCRAITGIPRLELIKQGWTIDEKRIFVKTNVRPQRGEIAVVVDDGDSSDVTSDEDKVTTANKLRSVAFGMDKVHSNRLTSIPFAV